MGLKLNMSKAYDHIEWSFMDAILRATGFPISWVSMIMKCVPLPSFSVLLNESLRQNFFPHRGL